ncbi:hypothetical protein BKA83DRAFT_689718, partial [Pisolithus microcarpus]
VASRMGTIESSVKGFVNSELSGIIARSREHNPIPLVVGLGVATRLHFDTVVVGSRIVSLMPGRSCSASGREGLKESSSSDSSTAGIQSSQYHYPFGSQYIPKALVDCFIELEEAHNAMWNDLTF